MMKKKNKIENSDLVLTISGKSGECPKCKNKYELPERDDSMPGFADIYEFYCKECGEFLGNVRIDVGIPSEGYGWVHKWKAPSFIKDSNE